MYLRQIVLELTFSLYVILVASQAPLQKPCQSKICMTEADRMKNKMDLNGKPCENFYQYACGKFQPKIAEDKTEIDEFIMVEDALREKLMEIMDEKFKINDGTAARLVKGFYQSCMNIVSINTKKLRPIMEFINQLKGWPMMDRSGWNKDAWNLQQLLQDLDFIGSPSHYLFHFSIKQDPEDTSRWVIYIDQPYLVTDVLDPVLGSAYYVLQTDIAQMFGIHHSNATLYMREVLNFEKDLKWILQPDEDRKDIPSLFNKVTIREFMRIFRSINWLNYLKRLMPQTAYINENTFIYISNFDFFMDLDRLVASTPKSVLANYLIWRLIYDSLEYLPIEMKQRKSRFLKETIGTSNNVTRWKECVDLTADKLNVAVSALYIRKNVVPGTKNDTRTIFNHILERFKGVLGKVEWMDEDTRTEALGKIEKLLLFNGCPDEHLNDEALTRFYSDLVLDDKEFFKSVFKCEHHLFRKDILKYRKVVNKENWESHSNSLPVTAYYDFDENSLVAPAAVLQIPFYNRERPNYLDFGALGYILGHELINSVDDEGKFYDAYGNMETWWSDATFNSYKVKAKCLINQYSEFDDPYSKSKVDGNRTLSKNVADNAGIALAYDAYQDWVLANEVEAVLPQLKLTQNQLFWIAAAQIWCQVVKTDKLKGEFFSDPHAPRQFRVNGPFSNSPAFAEDWKCPEGSAMNPANKCKIW